MTSPRSRRGRLSGSKFYSKINFSCSIVGGSRPLRKCLDVYWLVPAPPPPLPLGIMRLRANFGLGLCKIRTYGFSTCFFLLDPRFVPIGLSSPARGNRKCQRAFVSGADFERTVRKRLAASGGGHTLRFHDLGMILAWHRDVVSDREHSAFVMKKDGQSGKGGGGPRLKLIVAIPLV